ncbi:6-phosphogluconolactonase [Georgenia satyanarayanai]|uniref:6-phosphogluconolactonase n=1 Tax=Georgenia satyanarayanai TaxID=860221 RepID=UPI00203F72DA|nr:6-phosphogluconolactonase [Georgenia satyanarayanai]MCM3661344.1 6-phosphogluconolactonase [Georgenia satyanarayanai]
MTSTHYGDLEVTVLPTNEEAGAVAAEAFAVAVREALATRDEIAVILATGNSQLAFTEAATARDDIDWSRITVLHMDEYLGMSAEHPASFRRWMRENLAEKVNLKALEGVKGDHEPVEEELARYTRLIEELEPAVCVMGIGENGHLAFNDPPADFETPDLMRLVAMDEVSRQQQVGEGHFSSLAEAPTHALTMTIPALLRPATVLVNTPEARKAAIVKAALEGPITPAVPASILRRQPHARLFLDADSAALLDPATATAGSPTRSS